MPRPRKKIKADPAPAAILGALIGGLLSRSPAGAIAGGAIGAAAVGNTRQIPVPLEEALKSTVPKYGFRLISLRRLGSRAARVSVLAGDNLATIDGRSPPGAEGRDKIDDYIFDDIINKIRMGDYIVN